MCALTVFGLMPSAFAVSLAAVTLMYEQAGLPRSSSSRSGPPMSARTRLVASGLIRDAMTVNHVWKGCTITVTARPGDRVPTPNGLDTSQLSLPLAAGRAVGRCGGGSS
jgi:hypothetical protein